MFKKIGLVVVSIVSLSVLTACGVDKGSTSVNDPQATTPAGVADKSTQEETKRVFDTIWNNYDNAQRYQVCNEAQNASTQYIADSLAAGGNNNPNIDWIYAARLVQQDCNSWLS